MKLTPTEQAVLLQYLPETGSSAYWRLQDEEAGLSHTFLSAPTSLLQGLLAPAACAEVAQIRRQGDQHPLVQRVKRDLHWSREQGIHLLHADSVDYPELLRQTRRAPSLLFVWGNPAALSLPQLAVVGSRNASPGGRDNAARFAADLAAKGVAITSGLALGIDAAAHNGALSGGGVTLAVLGTGIDRIYPSRHVALARQIVEHGGAVVSEFPLGTGPQAANFPRRNRIISGLSFGVLVVEAAVRSGSLITARYALQQDREVFAIPGSIHNPVSRGCHALIKEGAKLVETAQDVIDEASGFLALKWQEAVQNPALAGLSGADELIDTEQEQHILEQVGFDPVNLDQLMARTGMGAGELTAALVTLELKGAIANNGNSYSRAC